MAGHTSQQAQRPSPALSASDLTRRGVVLLAAIAMLFITGLDLIDGSIGFLFSLGFILIVVTAALAVNVRELFTSSVMPPLLLLGALLALCLCWPASVAVDGTPADA